MNIDERPFTRELACWSSLHLPARLNVAQTAKLLGFAEHDIQILMAARKLAPLGAPAQNAPKWFCACEIIALVSDRDWLSKATLAVSRYWLTKRQRRSSNTPAAAETSGVGPSAAR